MATGRDIFNNMSPEDRARVAEKLGNIDLSRDISNQRNRKDGGFGSKGGAFSTRRQGEQNVQTQSPKIDLGVLNKFGKAASSTPGFDFTTRNNKIIQGLGSMASDEGAVRSYLGSQAGFSQARKEDQENTIKNIMRQQATTATPENPVQDISFGNKLDSGYDPSNPQDYLYRFNARTLAGEKMGPMDYYNKQLAEAAVAKQREAADYESKYQKTYDEQAAAAKTREQAAVDAFEKSLNTKYAGLRKQQEEANRQNMEALQRNMGLYGVGESSYAVEQSTNQQNLANNALNLLEQQKNAELQAFKAEQAGVTGKALEPYLNAVNEIRKAKVQADADLQKEQMKNQAQAGGTLGQMIKDTIEAAKLTGTAMDEKKVEMLAKSYLGAKDKASKDAILGNMTDQEKAIVLGLAVKSGNFEFIERTKTQPAGYFNKDTGEFVPLTMLGMGGGGGGRGGLTSGYDNDFVLRLNRIANAFINSPKSTRAGILTGAGSIAADWQYIRENLMLKKFADAKKAGITFGAASEAEWEALRAAASSLKRSADNPYVLNEINRLITSYGGKAAFDAPTVKETGEIVMPTKSTSNPKIDAFTKNALSQGYKQDQIDEYIKNNPNMFK